MKVLYVSYDHIDNPWLAGGGATRTDRLSRGLAEKGHTVSVISGGYPRAEDSVDGNLSIRFVGRRKGKIASALSFAGAARGLVKRECRRYDVLVEDFAYINPVCLLQLQNKIPTVLQLHHLEGAHMFKRYGPFAIPYYLFERFYPRRARNTVAVSVQTKRKFCLQSCRVISNGIDDQLLSKNVRQGDYALYLGRINFHNKGIDTLLNANLPCKLMIVGKGRDENQLQHQIAERDDVEYIGFVSETDKRRLLQNCRLLILPSRYEGQGIVAIEAAALGKPVVASDIAELHYVREQGFGLNFRCGNALDLGRQVSQLCSNQQLWNDMSAKARKFAEQRRWSVIVDQFEAALEDSIRSMDSTYD
jgi:glycogen synthase